MGGGVVAVSAGNMPITALRVREEWVGVVWQYAHHRRGVGWSGVIIVHDTGEWKMGVAGDATKQGCG